MRRDVQIPQRALGHIAPVDALKDWQKKRPKLFKKRIYKHAGPDMQLMPLVYIGMGPEKVRTIPLSFERTINPFNADNNIERGAVFLGMLRNMLKPHMRGYARSTQKKIIFHAYNCGVTRVIRLLKKHGLGYRAHLPGETKAYLDKLLDFPRR